jgi:hypothetical protein
MENQVKEERMRTSLRGLAVSTLVRTVSSDGKTLTVVQKGTDPKGRKVSNTVVDEQ